MRKTTYLTLGQVAKLLGVRLWCIQRLYEADLLGAPDRIGILRVVTEEDLPAIRAALVKRGYLEANSAPPSPVRDLQQTRPE